METLSPTVDVVLASYNEDLRWTKFLPDRWNKFVYCSNENRIEFPPGITPIRIPNGGREAGQWLKHIVRNYGEFSDFTVFLQGMPFPHNPEALLKLLIDDKFEQAISYVGGLPPTAFFNLRPVGDVDTIIRKALGSDEPFYMIPFQAGAQFYVRKDVIMARPKEFYSNLLENAYNGQYPNFGHLMEPAWGCVFDWRKFV
jgi:hypothetical protein